MRTAFAVAVLVTSISLAHAAATLPQTGPVVAVPAHFDARLTRLAADAKMLDASRVLQAFRDGAETTAIIVTLKSTPKAKYLAEISRPSMRRPLEVDADSAPVFYDLADLAIREALHDTVTETVAQAVEALTIPGMTIKQKFSYQFGFAAEVTVEALEAILQHPDVIQVTKDGILLPQLRQGIPVMNATVPRMSYTGKGLAIAIADTGIDTSHPKLGNGGTPIFNSKVIGGYNTGDGNGDPRPQGQAHGTEVAGIAAGDWGEVGDYIGGVAPDAKLYALKISPRGSGNASDSSMIAAWEWAIKHQNDNPAYPIMIVNTSFGGGSLGSASECDRAVPQMTTAAYNAVQAGITLFVSSGNDGLCGSMGWPGCISHVNSVGAVYDADIGRSKDWCIAADACSANKRLAFGGCDSGWYAWDANTWAKKVTVYSNSAPFLTLFAPAHNAYTTTIGGGYMPDFGGTSAASPYAAGAAAVLQDAAKSKLGRYLTPAEVRQYLTSTGELITDSKVAVTKPLVNLEAAVARIPGGAQPNLSVHLQGSGSGSVASAPAGIACTGSNRSCIAPFSQGTTVTLTATPAADNEFVTWIGAGCPSTGTCTVAMSQDQQVWATFAKSGATYALTVYPQGTGNGKVTSVPAGIDCGATCVAYFASGAVVTLAARANPGDSFHGWAGPECSGTGSCTVTLSKARQVWASFAKGQ